MSSAIAKTLSARSFRRARGGFSFSRRLSSSTDFGGILVDPASLMTYRAEAAEPAPRADAPPSLSAPAAPSVAPLPSSPSSPPSPKRFSTLSKSLLSVVECIPPASSADASARQDLARWTPQLTKIVATIGPTSEQLHVMEKVVRSGMRIMRLNFSHATVEEVELRTKNLALCKGRHGLAFPDRLTGGNNLRAVLLDTRGPEIRTGKLRNDATGKDTVALVAGESVTLRTCPQWAEAGSTESDLYVDYADLARSVTPGMKVLLDDGAASLTVEKVLGLESENTDTHTVVCRIDNSADLRSRAGVNLPGAKTTLPAITAKDKVDIKYGLTKDIDYIAASFVQNAEGVRDIRNYVRHVMTNDLGMDPNAPAPLIISKIESVSGLLNFDDILMESDGIMVARGDLGVEIPIQQVTNAQKEMIAACNAVGKPVIVATQMLESMAKNPRPTRAEVADVSNAVYDGADCLMLSGETAKGDYPVESVRMMNEIILGAERFAKDKPRFFRRASARRDPMLGTMVDHDRFIPQRTALAATAMSAVAAAEDAKVSAIVCITERGFLPRLLSAYRPNVPIVAFCKTEKMARQLMVFRNVHPVLASKGLSKHKQQERAIADATQLGFLSKGDMVVVVGVEKAQGMGNVATMKVVKIPETYDDFKPDKKKDVYEKVIPPCV